MASISRYLLTVLLAGNIFYMQGKLFNLFDNGSSQRKNSSLMNCSKYINSVRSSRRFGPHNESREMFLHKCIHDTAKDKEIIPKSLEENQPFKIKFQFSIDNLVILKNDGSLDLMVTIYIYWYDDRMAWDEMEIPVSFTRLPMKEIWHPIFRLANCHSRECILKPRPDFLIYLESDGDAFYEIDELVEANCRLNLVSFPFDWQSCKLTFLVMSAYSPEIVVESYPIGFRYFKPMSEDWEIISVDDYGTNFTGYAFNRTDKGKWDIKHEWVLGWSAPGFVVQIDLRRRSSYFVYNVIAPVIIISLIGFVTVFLPEDSSDKLNLTITVLLAFVFIQSNVAILIPKSDETPHIANYILNALILSAANLVASIMVAGICRIKATKPPNRFLLVVIRFISIFNIRKVAVILASQISKINWNFLKRKNSKTNGNDAAPKRESERSSNAISILEELEYTHWNDIAKFVNRLLIFLYCFGSLLNFYLILLPMTLDKRNQEN